MSGEQQLERSVLENKERDELHAIADAMGLKPASRTKKADLVDTILRATGGARAWGPAHAGGEERGRNGDRAERTDRGPRGFEGGGGGEQGNRRGRRRRGRDRDRSERDLQGQGQDVQFQGEPVAVQGFLDLRDEGSGVLRPHGFLPSP